MKHQKKNLFQTARGLSGLRRFTCLTMLTVLLLLAGPGIRAEIIPPMEPEQQIGYPAVVLCETLTLREKPSASSKVLQTLNYGAQPIVVSADRPDGIQEQNGFLYCTLGDSIDSPCGWINKEFLFINPAWYVTQKNTSVYAWDASDAPKVALLDSDVQLPILREEEGWYLVSLRGAVGWIQK